MGRLFSWDFLDTTILSAVELVTKIIVYDNMYIQYDVIVDVSLHYYL